jgi:hypothetical protein
VSGCAIDPATGRLAVTDLETTKLQYGNVVIYDKTGRLIGSYTSNAILYCFSCAYDDKGNLYADEAQFGTNRRALTCRRISGS